MVSRLSRFSRSSGLKLDFFMASFRLSSFCSYALTCGERERERERERKRGACNQVYQEQKLQPFPTKLLQQALNYVYCE